MAASQTVFPLGEKWGYTNPPVLLVTKTWTGAYVPPRTSDWNRLEGDSPSCDELHSYSDATVEKFFKEIQNFNFDPSF